MFNRRRAIGFWVAVAMAGSAALSAQKKDDKKLDDGQKKETQTAIATVDAVAAGTQQAPNDLGLAWVRQDFLKAAGNKQYAPFIVTVDPSKATTGPLTFYWRVVAKSAPATTDPAGTTGKKDDKKDKDKKKNEYAYEDRSFVALTPPAAGAAAAPMQIRRSFTVPAGDYDVYVFAKEPTSPQKGAPPAKMSVLKQPVTVPDFWNGELNTSSLIVAKEINPLPAPLTPDQQADRPYAMGTSEIVPSLDNKLTKAGELRLFFLIYNPKTDAQNKPNVTIEYSFCQPGGGEAAAGEPKPGAEACKPGEKFFNKTKPLDLNASTLPPQFDLAAGHQLQGSQAIPLATFPPGDYRLDIRITDKIANKTITRDVNFTVTAS